MKNIYKIFFKKKINLIFILLSFFVLCESAYAELHSNRSEKSRVINLVKKAQSYIQKNGIEKSIVEFNKNSQDIFVGDYNGMFFVSPLHPELIGKNQYNYKDASGNFVVQEEIEKAKAGGGWLKARWRKNPQSGQYVCRKIYILPISGNYFIGSWYHYPSNREGFCLY